MENNEANELVKKIEAAFKKADLNITEALNSIISLTIKPVEMNFKLEPSKSMIVLTYSVVNDASDFEELEIAFNKTFLNLNNTLMHVRSYEKKGDGERLLQTHVYNISTVNFCEHIYPRLQKNHSSIVRTVTMPEAKGPQKSFAPSPGLFEGSQSDNPPLHQLK